MYVCVQKYLLRNRVVLGYKEIIITNYLVIGMYVSMCTEVSVKKSGGSRL